MKAAYALTISAVLCVIGILGILFFADWYAYCDVFNDQVKSGETVLGVMDYVTLRASPYQSSALHMNYHGLTRYDFETSYGQPCTVFHRPNILDYQRFEYYVVNSDDMNGIQCVGAADYDQFLGEHDYETEKGLLIVGVIVGSLLIVVGAILAVRSILRMKRSNVMVEEDLIPIMSDSTAHDTVQ